MIIRLFGIFLFAVVCIATSLGQNKTKSIPADHSNIILFLVDDMGWQDTSVPFHDVKTPFNALYRTPNMERLAQNGMIFTSAYAASPVCTPTRTSLMTGQNPARSNITNWTLRNDVKAQETAPAGYPLRSPNWNVSGLQSDDVTLPKLLKKEGYRTIHVGKAHFGALNTPGADPKNLGFDVNIAGHAAGSPGSYYGKQNYARNPKKASLWDVPGLKEYHGKEIYLTKALTFEAIEAIEQSVQDERPFFMNMAHYAVHTPIMADSQFVDLYSNMNTQEAAYASMIQGMDASLGALMDKLEALDIAKNTLILFMSDNGGLSAHSRGRTVMDTGLNLHNLPLRSGKGSAYEGGIHVPMIAAWAQPDSNYQVQKQVAIPGGTINDTPVIADDFFATILEIANISIPEDYEYDGQNLVPLLIDKNIQQAKERILCWHYPHKWGPTGPGLDPFTAIRQGDWKLIYFYKSQRWELYNLGNDISETRNLVRERPLKAKELAGQMLSWMKRVKAQLPIDKATAKPVEWPTFNTIFEK